MSTLLGLLIAIAIVGLPSILILWIASKLKLGLEINGFRWAVIVAIIIAVVAGVLTLVVGFAGFMDDQGLVGGIVHLIVSAAILLVWSRYLPGLKVANAAGVLVPSVAIGAFYWLGGLLLGQMIH
jgi:uncharacterized membrane protein YvlD (DUF360 family)